MTHNRKISVNLINKGLHSIASRKNCIQNYLFSEALRQKLSFKSRFLDLITGFSLARGIIIR